MKGDLLHHAFRADLPPASVDRPKRKFSKGAGSSNVIARKAEGEVSNRDLSSEREQLLYQGNYRLPDKEALYYYRILHKSFKDQWIIPSLGRSL